MKVTTMRGQVLDMSKFLAEHPETRAVGNANLNARGDRLGAGGKIIKKREVIAMEYHKANPKSVKQVSMRDIGNEVFASPAAAVKALKAANEAAKQTAQPVAEEAVKKPRKLTDAD